MQVELAEERVFRITSRISPEEAEGRAWARRADAFGAIARVAGLFGQNKDEPFEVVYRERRLQPFWRAAASTHRAYERTRDYPVKVAADVEQVRVGDAVLKVTGGYVREPLMKDMAGGYVTIVNTGRADDRLTSVTSDLAAEVSMHRTTAAGQMEPVTSFTIPAGGRLVLAKGGNHLMLMNLRRMPAVGDTVTFQLHFAKSAPLTVRVPVQPTSYVPKG